MRFIQRIPHEYLGIYVFYVNDLYLLKIQLGPFEQILKFSGDDVPAPEYFGRIIESPEIMKKINDNFEQLRQTQILFLDNLVE